MPSKSERPFERGHRLAKTAMQMLWKENAHIFRISQISHPETVLDFIKNTPGLSEVCHEHLPYLASYAPQLTIKGFGGEFEDQFDEWYRLSMAEYREKATGKSKEISELCGDLIALRNPKFGNYSAERIACNLVQGEIHGPDVKFYETIDYIIWFLSEQSYWMPQNIRKFLIKGFKGWGVWIWHKDIPDSYDFGFKSNSSTGSLVEALFNTKKSSSLKLTRECIEDIETRFAYTIGLLNLKESPDILAKRFIDEGFIEVWLKERQKRSKRKDF